MQSTGVLKTHGNPRISIGITLYASLVKGLAPIILDRIPPELSEVFFFTREKKLYDIQVYVIEMSQVYQKPVLFDQKRFFHYFRAPKPPQANPKTPIP